MATPRKITELRFNQEGDIAAVKKSISDALAIMDVGGYEVKYVTMGVCKKAKQGPPPATRKPRKPKAPEGGPANVGGN